LLILPNTNEECSFEELRAFHYRLKLKTSSPRTTHQITFKDIQHSPDKTPCSTSLEIIPDALQNPTLMGINLDLNLTDSIDLANSYNLAGNTEDSKPQSSLQDTFTSTVNRQSISTHSSDVKNISDEAILEDNMEKTTPSIVHNGNMPQLVICGPFIDEEFLPDKLSPVLSSESKIKMIQYHLQDENFQPFSPSRTLARRCTIKPRFSKYQAEFSGEFSGEKQVEKSNILQHPADFLDSNRHTENDKEINEALPIETKSIEKSHLLPSRDNPFKSSFDSLAKLATLCEDGIFEEIVVIFFSTFLLHYFIAEKKTQFSLYELAIYMPDHADTNDDSEPMTHFSLQYYKNLFTISLRPVPFAQKFSLLEILAQLLFGQCIELDQIPNRFSNLEYYSSFWLVLVELLTETCHINSNLTILQNMSENILKNYFEKRSFPSLELLLKKYEIILYDVE
jgi:hypothetical protein